ncbi:MAG: glycoside-pentoside-hexuronide (GPH):cation symporter, partial [Edwardsiella sp. (in: enterobacteria)]
MSQSLSWRAVIGYGCGDMANNVAFAMGALFLLSYYTDVAGVGAAAAGAMLLSVRILDAFIDVIAGRVVDKTTTRWGKFRPYLVFGALPLMLCSILVFSVPADWSHDGKVFYAYATYIALNICYSFVNIPYGSLATVMTQDPAARAKLGMARSIGAGLTFVLIGFVISPRLSSSTPAELQTLYTQLTMVLAVVGIALYLFCFASTREVIQRQVAQPSFRASLGTLRRNRPLFMLCVCALCTLGASFSVSASTIFYARYILNDVSLLALFVAMQTLLGMLLAAPAVPFLVRRLGKRNTFLAGLLLAAL